MQILILNSTGIASSREELSTLLLHNFLQAFITNSIALDAILFYSDGVKLCCQNSSVLSQLQILESFGAQLLVCGTCVNFFELQNELVIGEITNMPTIVKMQMEAYKFYRL
jgi:intracellular sulfur oxidation DsrE/DsrF family protein